MRIALAFTAALFLFAATPAWACKCTPDADGSRAAAVMNDPSLSVVDVYVRAVNPRNHQSMLDIKDRHSGSLMAQYVRAKFGSSSCAVHPLSGRNMTLIIKNEPDGTYSVVGDCEHSAVMQHLKKGR